MTAAACHEEDAFDRKVAAWVLSAVDANTEDFETLLERLPGVYPTLIRKAVEALLRQRMLRPDLAARLLRPSLNAIDMRGVRSPLPLPHPLNYEWRFTPKTSSLLLNLAEDCARSGEMVLLFGTPAVAVASFDRPSNRRLIFFGEDNPVTRSVNALNEAIGRRLAIERCSVNEPGRERASVVVLDPPWYLDFVRPMLAMAAGASTIGGHVLMGLAPEGARPSALQDRNHVLMLAEQLGLLHVKTQELALRYETPFFEANALAACGMVVSETWRRGDLLMFRKIRRSDRSIVTSALARKRWREVRVGRMRLFVCPGRPSQGGDLLGPLIQGDVLPTVSRRDERRQAARIWTSGNRIFTSSAPEMVLAAALSLSGAQPGAGARPELRARMKERAEMDRVGHLLLNLAACEAAEEAGRRVAQTRGRQAWTLTSTASENALTAIGSG
jgi:hypothetical protein